MNVLIIPRVTTAMAIACGISCVDRAHAQETATTNEPSRVTITFGERPSIRFGHVARIDLRMTMQADGRASEVSFDPDDSRVGWERRRVGIGGVVAHRFGFQIDRELGEGGVWKDVYLDYQQFDAMQVQAGQFKLPFSREETTSPAHLDFAYRARAVDSLAAGRDRGVMVRGQIVGRTFAYELGVFRHDGTNGQREGPAFTFGGRSVAARIVARPFRNRPSAARTLEVGAAGVWTDVSEGLTSIQGETALGRDFYETDLWVSGPQRRQGVEFSWRPGPCSVTAEFIRLTAERRHQSVEETDLSPFLATGWYVSGAWIVTGERKVDGPQNPLRPFPRGPGAIETAIRLEGLEFSSAARDDEPSASPRADVVLGNRLRGLTVGVNWYPMRWVRLQVNAIREALDDPSQGPVPAERAFWTRVIRLQFHW